MHVDIARNGQVYTVSGMACRITYQLSTRSSFLRFSYIVLRDYAEKPGVSFFNKEVGNPALQL